MTSTQAGTLTHNNPAEPDAGYGYGWGTTRTARAGEAGPLGGPCGHGGAYQTNLWIDSDRGLVDVFMVHQSGRYLGEEGAAILLAFQEAAASLSTKKLPPTITKPR